MSFTENLLMIKAQLPVAIEVVATYNQQAGEVIFGVEYENLNLQQPKPGTDEKTVRKTYGKSEWIGGITNGRT